MMTKINYGDWLAESTSRLLNSSEYPLLETQVLLGFVTGKPREWLISHPGESLQEEQLHRLNSLLSRLIAREPLPYITGKQAFFGLDFQVSPDVLIPRPETELLIEESIEWLEEHPSRRKMADIGTGSGIIAVTLADHFNDLQVTAVDISERALAIAQKNAEKYSILEQVTFIQNDLLEGINQKFDLIAANLPYIPSQTLESLNVKKFEPRLALDGGPDGLVLIGRLLDQSRQNIHPGGLIILEIEAGQSESVFRMAEKIYPEAEITILNDLAKHPRIAKIQL